MRLLVTGDRNWTNYDAIYAYLAAARAMWGVEVVIEGEANGADLLSRRAAEELGISVEPYPANWEPTEATPPQRIRRRRDGTPYDVAAGPIRNQQMLDEGKPDRAVAFHADLATSKGTLDMVKRLERAGIPVDVVPDDTREQDPQMRLT